LDFHLLTTKEGCSSIHYANNSDVNPVKLE